MAGSMDLEYKKPPQAPLAFNATAESIAEENKAICNATREMLDGIIRTVPPEDATFNTIILPIAQHENERQLKSKVLSFYLNVSTDPAIRAASAAAQKERLHFLIDCGMREDVFRLVDAVFQKDEALDPESRKYLLEERRNYLRNGIAVTLQSGRERFVDIKKRLSSIATEFSNNLDEEICTVWFTREELEGVPEDSLGQLESGSGDYDGKLGVSLKGLEVGDIMASTLSSETRRGLSTQSIQRGQMNIPLFEEAIRLRNEAAQILGYPNHAAYRLETKMAKTPEAVMVFLEDLRDRALRHKSKEINLLLSLKLEDLASRGLPSEDELYSWDVAYCTRLFHEKCDSIDSQKIAEYFPLGPTVAAMLKLFGSLFGFVFIELKDDEDRAKLSPTGKGSDLIWHEDVIMYQVWNDEGAGGGFAGYLYLDLHPRQGKYGGAQCYPVQLGFTHPDGRRHYPSTALLTNFTKPTPTKPSLLRHHEVKMLFHELGHGMHDLSGRCKYSRYYGAETVGDFNEAPSQMLENWCWNAEGLRVLSSHYMTGEPLPDNMIASLIKAKHSIAALGLLRQLKMCLFDMEIHSAQEGDGHEQVDVSGIYRKYIAMDGIKGVEDKYGYSKYRHLLNGYDAGMYNYLWSNTHAMDMFDTAFKQDPMDGKQGRRYRHMVLEKGGSQDEMKTLTDFLGREPRSAAFFKDLGLD